MKWVCTFIVTFAALVAVWLGILRTIEPAPDARWIEALYRKKEKRADSISGPRIFLVGGSSVHFSLSAKQASDETGLEFVNFGSHAGLGYDYLLSRARRNLRRGDVVVLSIEYHLPLLRSSKITSSQVGYSDLQYLAEAPIDDIPPLLFGVSPSQALRSQLVQLLPGAVVDATVNSYGDETRNERPPSAEQIAAVRRTGAALGVGYGRGTKNRRIEHFINWCKENAIDVIFVPPVIYMPGEFRGPVTAAGIGTRVNEFYAQFGARTPSVLEDYFMDLDEMYDTVSHANAKGRTRATRTLVRDVCGLIACPAMRSGDGRGNLN